MDALLNEILVTIRQVVNTYILIVGTLGFFLNLLLHNEDTFRVTEQNIT